MKPILAAALMTVLSATANAETLSMEREGTGTSDTKVMQVAEGHLVMVTQSTYDNFSGADDVMSASTGVCNGTMEMMAGKLSGGGHCVYADADGDTWVVNWTPNAMTQAGAVEGNWMITGGSGKYLGATGAGTFSSLTNRETGKFVNKTTGEATLK